MPSGVLHRLNSAEVRHGYESGTIVEERGVSDEGTSEGERSDVGNISRHRV